MSTTTTTQQNEHDHTVEDYVFFNDTYRDEPVPCDPPLQFPLFSRLVPELRLKIWQLCLPAQRMLSVTVDAEDADAAGESYTSRNALGNIVSGQGYRLRIGTVDHLSPLLRICRDSRQAALSFHRAHVPCDSGGGAGGGGPCLYFRPESDIIHVIAAEDAEDRLADFVHNAKAYDRKGLGILHMAIGGQFQIPEINLPMDPSRLAPRALASLRETVSSLRSITLIDIVRSDCRHMFSSLLMAEARYNRSVPLWSPTAAFTLVPGPDPRPVADDLARTCVGWDPRGQLSLWRALLSRLDLPPPSSSPSSSPSPRVLLAAPPVAALGGPVLRSRAAAAAYVRREERAWAARFEPDGIYARFGHANPDYSAETLARPRPLPAVGFWLFPAEAFGDVPPGPGADVRWEMERVVDLGGFPPQVGVFALPGA